ncbi:protein VASCULAR ASSOCIATED DEATH 1, chloroplastic-like isoform X2 [Zingiber officinale]|uniref:protein VASCULAR ASSOCIATED DEATH 1, chloroplastic-like isoform X2 n=1 Tax=Zingiber officinale TaxID=94328 RepID=UPI001C4CCB07|nr:protein VASCULAR ASSOCIATED DEATH 1, chloroplastic-like isoform X2 [Zingiber officinale]
MVAAASPTGNSDAHCSLPSSSPVAPKPDDEDASGNSTLAQSVECCDRRDGDMLNQVLSNRSEEYRLLFRLPSEEVLIKDFNCAFQENILLQGHMYLFIHHICFYSNIFGFETKRIIPLHQVTAVRKAKTVAIFPNAIEIFAGGKKYFFGSFLARDEAYGFIIDSCTQHGVDIKTMDTKSEGSNQGNGSIIEKIQECNPLADDSSSSSRFKDANAKEELNPLLNGEVRDISLKPSKFKENECEENFNESSLEIPFIWIDEDIDAPTVPEGFTIVAESKFPLLVKEFFNLFVSNEALDFLRDFHSRCGDKDFQCTSWRKHELFGYTRNISFVHPVKVYLGPKFGNCQEVQKFRVYRNSHLVIETSQHVSDVPYGDYFEVEGFWDVVQDTSGENSCTVKVYSNVAFSKKTLFKGKIEQSTKEECREVYATWMIFAHDTLKGREQNVQQSKDGIFEKSNCVVPDKGVEFTRAPESIENPISTSRNLLCNVNEMSNKPGVDDIVNKQSEKCSLLMSTFRESWENLLSYMRRHSLVPLLLAGAFFVIILLQLIMILVLTRVPEVHVVTHGNYISDGSAYNVENVEWLEKRFNYLKEELVMMETRVERMRHEYALLRSHLQSLERLKFKKS